MSRLFLYIYDYFEKHRVAFFAILFSLVAVLAVMASQVRFQENITNFFNSSSEEKNSTFENLAVKDKIIVLISGEDPDEIISSAEIFEEQIARVNGEYDKKLYDQQMQLQRYRTTLLVLVFILLTILAVMLIVWLVRILLYHRRNNVQLKAEKVKLEELNVELVDTTNKQTRKLYAVSDICKNTYASVVLANPEMIKVISRSLHDSLSAEYPQLSNMDYTYMFLDFIGLSVRDICQMLSVQEGTYYCRRSAIKKKISSDTEQDIDELLNQFFLGKLVTE